MASSGKLLATEGSIKKKKKNMQETLSWPSFSADICSVGAHPAAASFPGTQKPAPRESTGPGQAGTEVGSRLKHQGEQWLYQTCPRC